MLACCDVIIAAENSTIGLGGPAMIEGGGLGIYTPEEVGPMSFQVPNGVVDILVKDDEEAIEAAKKYLSYFQGPIDEWEAPDQRSSATSSPRIAPKMYDMREIIETIADQWLDPRDSRSLRHRHHHRVHPRRGQADGADRQQSAVIFRARSTATRRTRLHASCSCATHSIFRCCR